MSHITGIATNDCGTVGRLVAIKTLLNEFVAYLELMRATDLSKRSVAIATYALCGFSNPGSVGIQLATHPVPPLRKPMRLGTLDSRKSK